MEPALKSITLYYREGASDKVYQASIHPKDGGYVVTFAFGRRGSTLSTGMKTSTPVDYETAQRVFNRLIEEKTVKGYTPGEDGTPYRQTGKETQNSGIHCQLLNPINEDQLDSFLDDPVYCIQEKFDG